MSFSMRTNAPDFIEQISTRICELQKSQLSLQAQLKNAQHGFERKLDESALCVIDILDMINATQLDNSEIADEAHSNAKLIIKKIEKRLIELLKHWQVQEIVFKAGRVEVGKTRVLETRKVSEDIPIGTILEICREGYQRGVKVIRPADVITGLAEKCSNGTCPPSVPLRLTPKK